MRSGVCSPSSVLEVSLIQLERPHRTGKTHRLRLQRSGRCCRLLYKRGILLNRPPLEMQTRLHQQGKQMVLLMNVG
jgi:hypothetical protein